MGCCHPASAPDVSCCPSGKGVILRPPFIFLVPSIFERSSYYLFCLKESFFRILHFSDAIQGKNAVLGALPDLAWKVKPPSRSNLWSVPYGRDSHNSLAPKVDIQPKLALLQNFLSLICPAQSFTLCFHTQFITWTSLKVTGCSYWTFNFKQMAKVGGEQQLTVGNVWLSSI